MAAAKTKTFAPVILFEPSTQQDFMAVQMVHSIMEDITTVMQTERSKQLEIGVSEIGGECKRCVARALSLEYASVPEDPMKSGWKAQIGTFGHAGLEEHIAGRHAPHEDISDSNPQYHLERRLHIWHYEKMMANGQPYVLDLGGSCDLYIQGLSFGIVVDWKFQGARTLGDSAKGKLKDAYKIQMPTYGLGYQQLGFPVTHTLLYALPRDGELVEAKPVLQRYDPTPVIATLKYLKDLIDGASIVGWDAVIDAQPRAGFCFDCNRFDAWQSEDLLGAFRRA